MDNLLLALIMACAATLVRADAPRPSTSHVEILSPKDGEKLKPGQNFTVVIRTDPLVPIRSVGVLGMPMGVSGNTGEKSPDSLWRLNLRVPINAIGRSELRPVGIVGSLEQLFLGEFVEVEVDVSDLHLVKLVADRDGAAFVNSTRPYVIDVIGHYSDGVERDLTPQEFGVLVRSSDPTVAFVETDPHLAIRCVRPGQVMIHMSLGERTDSFAFKCYDDPHQ